MPSKADQQWERVRQDIRKGLEPVSFAMLTNSGVPGTYKLVATIPSLPYPIGAIHYRWHTKHRWEIVNFEVFDKVRRSGVGGKLLDELVYWMGASAAKEIYTQEVTDLSRSILKRKGYRLRADGWYMKPAKKRK